MVKFAWVALFFFSFQSQAADQASKDYWEGVDLPFSIISNSISNEFCYENIKLFLGCVHGSNAMLGHKRLAIVPSGNETKPSVGKVIEDWGTFKLAELNSVQEFESNSKNLERVKKERLEEFNALKGVFESNVEKFDFAKVTAYIEANVLKKDASNASVIAQGFNAYFGAADDPHTRIMPIKIMEKMRSSSGETFSGIGVRLSRIKNQLVIVTPIEGGPAEKAGLLSKDVITHVDGTDLAGQDVEQANQLLMGPSGSEVAVTVRRGEMSLTKKVVRAEIVVKNVTSRMLEDDRQKIGYVKLDNFIQGEVGKDIVAAVTELKNAKAEAIVFDLRGNGGGRLDFAVAVANVFLPKAVRVVSSKGLKLNLLEVFETTEDAVWELPLTTLIDAGSASASEIVSGALQDHKRGLVLGERSYGKGSVQVVRPYKRAPGVMILKTQATFHLPSGRSNQILGVVPDVEVFRNPNPTEEDKFAVREEDLYLNALPVSSEKFVSLQPELIGKVKDCMEKQGRAKAIYEGAAQDLVSPDYQLLSAQDALVCQK